jgi:hypothetical protein
VNLIGPVGVLLIVAAILVAGYGASLEFGDAAGNGPPIPGLPTTEPLPGSPTLGLPTSTPDSLGLDAP